LSPARGLARYGYWLMEQFLTQALQRETP